MSALDHQTLRLSYDYVPSTFEERGAALPFTTPELAFSRVRRGPTERLEVLVSGFSGSRCIYVFPWDQIVGILRLTLHDRALQAEISLTSSITPMRMRVASHRVARTGLAGPEAAAAAKVALDRVALDAATTQKITLARLVESSLGPGLSRPSPGRPAPHHRALEADELNAAIHSLSTRIGLPPNLCSTRVHELSEALAPVGFGLEPGEGGYLRRVFARVAGIRDSVSAANIGATGLLIAQTAGATVRLADQILTALNVHFDQVGRALIDWEASMGGIRHKIDRLGWLLDGWVDVCEMWDLASADRRNIDFKKIGQIMRVLPLVPKGECERAMIGAVDSISTVRNRIVQELQDWRTGDFDYEVVSRIEAIKAKSARI